MERRNSYAGLCVGGPLAGKSIACPDQSLLVAERGESRTFTYNWHHTGAQGFWIPIGESLHDAINTLAVAYVEKCNGQR
jgi:hypothetical protein